MENWDSFVIVFFALVVSYSFVIGKGKTLKIVLASYISVLTADGVGNMIQKYLLSKSPVLQVALSGREGEMLIILKIGIFVLLTILLATRENFEIKTAKQGSRFWDLAITGVFGIFSAGLIVSTLLVFMSGFSPIEAAQGSGIAIAQIVESSRLVKVMVENYSAWFSLPALFFIVTSFLGDEK